MFADRNGTSSVSGQAPAPVIASAGPGGNLISWDITPLTGRAAYDQAAVRWYDAKAAQWREETQEVDSQTDGG